jgi:uncharacterized protein (DUF983 family)
MAGEQGQARSLLGAMRRGWVGRCPSCGIGALFAKFLKIDAQCRHCNEELHHHRADDAPPYFTILIVGHIILALILIVEQNWSPPYWLQMSIWLPLTLVLIFWFLPRIKGALVGLQWANRMHGFGGND